MERLKAILADKILDISSGNGEDVKMKIERIQRFRDFANACQTLMVKYPQIEDELIKMINDGDFDTKVASSRVDSVIRLADGLSAAKSPGTENLIPESIDDIVPPVNDEPAEDADYEEVPALDSDEPDSDYVPYEELKSGVAEVSDKEEASIEDPEAKRRKEIITRVVQIVGIILAVIILIIIIKFVIKNWVVILSIIGGLTVLAIAIWFLRKKKN